MSRWAICSELRTVVAASAAVVLLVAARPAGAAGQATTQQEALRRAFPEPATVERRTAYLDSAGLARARRLAGPSVEIEQSVVTYYVGRSGDSALGVAYFDAHRVRTLPEVLMIVVDPTAAVERVEVLKFSEPPEYRPPEGWLGEFGGMELSPELARGRDVVNVTGATLTSRAVTRAVRRTLALHAVIEPLAGDGEPAGDDGNGSDVRTGRGSGPGEGP